MLPFIKLKYLLSLFMKSIPFVYKCVNFQELYREIEGFLTQTQEKHLNLFKLNEVINHKIPILLLKSLCFSTNFSVKVNKYFL